MMHRKATTLGLEERTERVLAYAFFWISGIFFLFFEKNRNVRWHALQSTIVFGTLWLCMFAVSMLRTILSVLLSIIPILGPLTSLGLALLFKMLLWITILLWLWLMLMALLQPNYRLPFFATFWPNFLRK
jgi:uncharacterized membrane protein